MVTVVEEVVIAGFKSFIIGALLDLFNSAGLSTSIFVEEFTDIMDVIETTRKIRHYNLYSNKLFKLEIRFKIRID